MSAADVAVLDSAAVDAGAIDTTLDTAVDQNVADVQQDTAVDDAQQDDAQAQDDAAAQDDVQADGTKEDNRLLPLKLREALKNLNAVDPKLAKELKSAWFISKELGQLGGIAEVKKLKETFDSLGGDEGIKGLQSELKEWSDIDSQFMEGNPALVDSLASIAPDSFGKLMPHFIDKFAGIDPAGYQHQMSRVIAATFQQSGLLNALYLMGQNLNLNNIDEAKKMLGEVSKWTNGIMTSAKTAPQPKAAQGDPLAAERKQLADREFQIFKSDVVTQWENFKLDKVGKELSGYLGKQNISDERKGIITQNVMQEVARVLNAKPDFRQKFEKLFTAKDKDGLLKFARSSAEAVIPDAVKKIYTMLYSNPGAPPKTAAPANGVKPAPAPVGWVKVAGTPKPVEVDYSKTGNDMIFKKQAVLKSGKKVYWGDNAPA